MWLWTVIPQLVILRFPHEPGKPLFFPYKITSNQAQADQFSGEEIQVKFLSDSG